jgi:hypothetical protein
VKVGDIVSVDGHIGFVTSVSERGEFMVNYGERGECFRFAGDNSFLFDLYNGRVIDLTAKQRAFVDATIAAEALRRIG